MPESLEDLFTAGTTGAESTADAQATQEIDNEIPEQNEISDIVDNEVPEQSEAEESTQDEPNYRELYEASLKEKETLEKRHRDLQSYNDTRFNQLQEQINSASRPVEKEEKQKELSKEELQDLMYEDPMKAFEYMQSLKQTSEPSDPAYSKEQLQLEIQEGVQREQHEDYDEVISRLKSVASYHPEIIEKINNSTNKAKTAYEEGKKLQNASQPQGDLEAIKAQLREEIMNELNENKTRPTLRGVPASAVSSKTSKPSQSFNSLFDAGRKSK
jgi:hypothetical protein